MDTGKLKLCPFCGYNDQINEGLCSPTLGPDGETNSPAIIVCPIVDQVVLHQKQNRDL